MGPVLYPVMVGVVARVVLLVVALLTIKEMPQSFQVVVVGTARVLGWSWLLM